MPLLGSNTGIFCISGSFDPKSKKYSKKDMFVGMIGIMLYQNMKERNNVNGFMGFGDLTDFQLKHQMWWKLDDLKRFAEFMNVSMDCALYIGLRNCK